MHVASADVVLHAVNTDADWANLNRLVEINFEEGLRAGRTRLPEDVVRGIVDGYRRKSRIAQFFIAETSREPCAYGSAIVCPNDLGMLEDFFTLPQCRGRGIASAIVGHCVGHCRSKGSSSVFIGARATERAKHLYARLGFKPLMISREWVKG
ncbi:GNAT family N-acetyltransferase [Methylocapsa sp. S129]|uniref:GNAT family N-acetyltransferase n=1 Tax=Methylocapsa sp. S129 TaxID=1641869 RepID=UPI003529ECE3